MYYIYNHNINIEQSDIIFLLNYTKDCGYQTTLFNKGDITLNPISEINRNKSIEDNIDIILKGIKLINKDEKKLNFILTKSVDEKENNIIPEKLEEIINKKIEDKNKIKINKLYSEFNKEIEINSHVFYLDN